MMKRLLCFTLLLALASGCAPRSHRLNSSYWPEEFPAEAVTAVADHLADVMAANYPPGFTSFYLAQTGQPKDELGPALETALRSRGFTLAPEKGGQALAISYILDRADETTWYSRLVVSDGLTVARTWNWTGDSLVMEAATRTGQLESADGQK